MTEMLEQVGMDMDHLYWENAPSTLKDKWIAVDEESINNSISTVITAASQKKNT